MSSTPRTARDPLSDIQPPSHHIKCLQVQFLFFQLIRQGLSAALFLPLLHPGDVDEHAQGVQIRPKQGFEAPQTRKGVHELQVSIDASFSGCFSDLLSRFLKIVRSCFLSTAFSLTQHNL